MRALWDSRGMTFVTMTQEQFAARIRNDHETYGKLIRQVGDKLD